MNPFLNWSVVFFILATAAIISMLAIFVSILVDGPIVLYENNSVLLMFETFMMLLGVVLSIRLGSKLVRTGYYDAR